MKYTLMHKNIETADILIDEVQGGIAKIEEVFVPEHLPIGTFHKTADRKSLNDWWIGRSIPASRDGIKEALEKLGISCCSAMLSKSYGASLSDHYWIKPKGENIFWKDINFYDNTFSEDIGDILFGQEIPKEINFMSPDNTSDGWLKKRWKIVNGERMLFKAGSNPFQQEPFNEVIASKLFEKLDIPHVDYTVVWQNEYPFSVCKGFVTPDTELIPAQRIMLSERKPNHINTYQHFVDCCQKRGIDAVSFLNKMLTADYIIANEDRHFNNFGLLRNPDTLEFIRFAPIYDSGTSLFYNRNAAKFKDYESKPFRSNPDEQLMLVTSFNWFHPAKLKSFTDDIRETFLESMKNGFTSAERTEQIASIVENRIKYISELLDKPELFKKA